MGWPLTSLVLGTETPCQNELVVRQIAGFEAIKNCLRRLSVQVNDVTKTKHFIGVELYAGVTQLAHDMPIPIISPNYSTCTQVTADIGK